MINVIVGTSSDHDMDFRENIWYILQENSIFNTWKLNN